MREHAKKQFALPACDPVGEYVRTEPPAIDFALPGLPIGTVGGLVGPGGAGKSTWMLAAAIEVAVPGANLLGLGLRQHGPVLMMSAEDPREIVHSRLHALGQRLTRAQVDAMETQLRWRNCVGLGVDVMMPQWYAAIAEAAAGCRLVVLDTLSRYHKRDENSAGEMAGVVSQLERLAAQTGAAVVYIHHTSKSAALNGLVGAQQAARGSSVLVDNARWLGFVGAMTETECKAYGIEESDRGMYVRWGLSKANYVAPMPDRWYRRGPGGMLMPVSLGEPQPARRARKLAGAAEAAKPAATVAIDTLPMYQAPVYCGADAIKAHPQSVARHIKMAEEWTAADPLAPLFAGSHQGGRHAHL